VSQNGLSSFIRSKREATTPADVGLPSGPRRRTPGLRRSELAMLAGLSVEYLTRIEQGRDTNPSPQILGALANALLLTPEERTHLLYAAKSAAGDSFAPCPANRAPSREVRPTVQAILDRLEPAPAVLCNDATDILASTVAYEMLAQAFPDWDPVGPGPEWWTGAERLAHPEVGELRLLYETLHLDGQRIIVYVPADDAASAALDQLIGVRPGALRSVTA
jgi:transcriptional regulator with XRE-family HTH domain